MWRIWRSRKLSLKIKFKFFNLCVATVATYGLEAMDLSDGAQSLLRRFNTSCIKKIRRNKDDFYVLKDNDRNMLIDIVKRREKWEQESEPAKSGPVSYEMEV